MQFLKARRWDQCLLCLQLAFRLPSHSRDFRDVWVRGQQLPQAPVPLRGICSTFHKFQALLEAFVFAKWTLLKKKKIKPPSIYPIIRFLRRSWFGVLTVVSKSGNKYHFSPLISFKPFRVLNEKLQITALLPPFCSFFCSHCSSISKCLALSCHLS